MTKIRKRVKFQVRYKVITCKSSKMRKTNTLQTNSFRELKTELMLKRLSS